MFSLPVENNVPLANYTTFKIGGLAKYFFLAKNEKDLQKIIQEAKDNHINYFILGNGSNILISDEGFAGLVIKIELTKIDFSRNKVIVDAGVKLGTLLSSCKDHNLSGLEFLAGLPATIGGAIWANAGSTKENIGEKVLEIKILDENNKIKVLEKKECNFSYRNSIFKNKNYIILEIILELEQKKKAEIEIEMEYRMKNKLATQDLKNPSVGSIFKNPVGEQKAWQLIEEVGLRGYELGGAKFSEKHCNFIINTGKATASDVIMLVSMAKQKVRDNLGIQLMEEVEYIGF